jgi:hypothetical protein
VCVPIKMDKNLRAETFFGENSNKKTKKKQKKKNLKISELR